ncbi:MAG: hypothetical protein L0H96_12355 [Humibacillus sp.]|nr:hypothetical protein [Humibacillus sp.]MDN5777698.1 hypothetical protein [Humibacillus sp.]
MTDPTPDRHLKTREMITVVLLAVTAVLTAWSGFESSKWGGEMSIAFSQASSKRIEAARETGVANSARSIDLQIFGIYLQALSTKNTELETFARDRFTDRFNVAFTQWEATKPLKNPQAAKSPFALDSYVPPGTLEAAAADKMADEKFQQALDFNQRGDNYTLLTVLFALVLFFGAFANRFRSHRPSWLLLGGAGVLLVVGLGLLLSFPKII